MRRELAENCLMHQRKKKKKNGDLSGVLKCITLSEGLKAY